MPQIVGRVRCLFKVAWPNLTQETHRVMSSFLPQLWIKGAIQCACFRMPTPPQIICQFIQAIDTSGHDRKDRHASIDFHRGMFPFLCTSCYLPVYLPMYQYISWGKAGQCEVSSRFYVGGNL